MRRNSGKPPIPSAAPWTPPNTIVLGLIFLKYVSDHYGASSVMDYVDDYLFDGAFTLIGQDGSVMNDNDTPVIQYVWGKCWVNNHVHVLTAKKGIAVEHLLLFLKTVNIRPFVTGAVQPKLNQANLCRVQVPLPPESVSQEFGRLIQPLFARIRSNTEESRTLAQLRDTLLPKLLSGELRVETTESAEST